MGGVCVCRWVSVCAVCVCEVCGGVYAAVVEGGCMWVCVSVDERARCWASVPACVSAARLWSLLPRFIFVLVMSSLSLSDVLSISLATCLGGNVVVMGVICLTGLEHPRSFQLEFPE